LGFDGDSGKALSSKVKSIALLSAESVFQVNLD
jgi:hypothetical protein